MDEGRFTETCASRFWRVLMGIILEELLASYTDVKKCSQEGREQMSIDTNNIYNTATGICDIQPSDDAKDLKYVLDYITCCKLDEPSDVVAWVEKHKEDYGREVVDSILNYAMAKKLNKQKFKELKEAVEGLYVEPEEEVVEEQKCLLELSFDDSFLFRDKSGIIWLNRHIQRTTTMVHQWNHDYHFKTHNKLHHK